MATAKDIKGRLHAFTAWFQSHGGYIHPSTELCYSPTHGVHLRVISSSENLPRGTLVISCPHTSSLSALNARDCHPFFPYRLEAFDEGDRLFWESLLEGVRPQFVAAIWLCAQWREGGRSWWREYLDVLPGIPARDDGDSSGAEGQGYSEKGEERGLGEVESPLWWEEEVVAWVRGTNLERGKLELEGVWRSEWERWEGDVMRWAKGKGWVLDWTLFKWAMTILGSRAFSSSQIASVPIINQPSSSSAPSSNNFLLHTYNPDLLLYPGIDSLNHNPLSQNRWTSDSERFGIICEDESGPGEEIWNPYGGKGNGELLLSYGFAIPANPCDTFALKLNQPPHPFLAVIASTGSSPSITSTTINSPTADPNSQGPLPMTSHNTPPALSLPHNTYFLRPSSRWSASEPDYPSSISKVSSLPPTGPPSTSVHYFTGIPHLLLSTLSVSLANTRERKLLQANPSKYGPLRVWAQLGDRNVCAVTALLLARLRMELSRLNALTSSADMASSARAALPTFTTTIRTQRRRALVDTYLSGQQAVLTDNITLLEDHLLHVLGAPNSVSDPQAKPTPTLLTLPHALSALATVDQKASSAFTAGMIALFATDDTDAWRNAGCEEDIWTLWIGVFIASLSHPNTPHTTLSDPARLTEWTAFACEEYNFPTSISVLAHRDPGTVPLTPTSPNSNSNSNSNDEELQQITAHILDLLSYLRDSSEEEQHTTAVDMWSAGVWTPAYVRACVDVVREESVGLQVRGGLLERLSWVERARRAEHGGGDEKGERDGEAEGEDAEAEEASVNVVALSVGLGPPTRTPP